MEYSPGGKQKEGVERAGGWCSGGFSVGNQTNTPHIIGFLVFLRLPCRSGRKTWTQGICALPACRELQALQKETSAHDSSCLSNRAAIHRAKSFRKDWVPKGRRLGTTAGAWGVGSSAEAEQHKTQQYQHTGSTPGWASVSPWTCCAAPHPALIPVSGNQGEPDNGASARPGPSFLGRGRKHGARVPRGREK